MTINTAKKLIGISVIMGTLMSLMSLSAYADCTSTYGGGEKCLVNKRFEIEKKVRIKDAKDDDWEDKVMDVERKDIVEFRIKIKNMSDEEAGSFDDMKMKDMLPKEMERVGGSGLTENWEDFEPGETKTFEIEAKVDKDEYDEDDKFDKCIVNKAEVYWDGNFEGADTATVCYGDDADEVDELPETGAGEGTLLGFGLLVAGAAIKLGKKFIS